MLGMHAGELKQDVGDALVLEHPTGVALMDWFVVFSALSLAAMYGLLGIGISLTWASVGMLNLAHGFTFASAGYGAYLASKHLVDTPTSGLDALIVGVAGILTGALSRGSSSGGIAFLPLHDRPNFPIRSLIATLAIALTGTQVFLLWFGPLQKPLPQAVPPLRQVASTRPRWRSAARASRGTASARSSAPRWCSAPCCCGCAGAGAASRCGR